MNGSARKPRSKFCVLHGRRAAQKRRKVGQVGGDSAFSLSRERGSAKADGVGEFGVTRDSFLFSRISPNIITQFFFTFLCISHLKVFPIFFI